MELGKKKLWSSRKIVKFTDLAQNYEKISLSKFLEFHKNLREKYSIFLNKKYKELKFKNLTANSFQMLIEPKISHQMCTLNMYISINDFFIYFSLINF